MRRLLITTLFAFFALASAAEAAQVFYQSSSDKLRVEDLAGEVNTITVAQSGQVFTITDSSTPLTIHAQSTTQCQALLSGAVECTVPVWTKAVNVDLNTGDDSATMATTIGTELEGDGGNDTLTGGAGPDTIAGDGDPLDVLDVATGNDVIVGGDGTDEVHAGPGDDVVKAEDGRAEAVDCGAGSDQGNADRADTLTACEAVVQPAAPAPAPEPQPEPQPKPEHPHGGPPGQLKKAAVPVPGKSVAVAVKKGVILVRRPGSSRAVPLDPSQPVPVGAVLDATKGTLTLTAANGGARAAQAGAPATQSADFTGASFVVGQKPGVPGTTLKMVGGDFSACGAPASGSRTTAYAAANRKRVRRLWGSGHGRFTTRGKNSSATVRGTIWIVEDRCDGTLTRVERGVVVVTDHVRNRTKVVRAGQSHFVPNATARKRRR